MRLGEGDALIVLGELDRTRIETVRRALGGFARRSCPVHVNWGSGAEDA
jgi:hypothetical protein